MIGKLKQLIEKHWDIVTYLFFGGLTTLVNYLVYAPLLHWLHLSAAVSNAIAWAVAVAFAYLTNKPFVFKSRDWSWEVVFPELTKFVSSRVFSGALETGILALTVDFLLWNGLVMKIVTSILVVVLNYVFSKLIVFRKADHG